MRTDDARLSHPDAAASACERVSAGVTACATRNLPPRGRLSPEYPSVAAELGWPEPEPPRDHSDQHAGRTMENRPPHDLSAVHHARQQVPDLRIPLFPGGSAGAAREAIRRLPARCRTQNPRAASSLLCAGRNVAQCAQVDLALELHDVLGRIPEVDPLPAVELGFVGQIQPHVSFIGHQPQQEPDLLLADAQRALRAADEAYGQPIAQPTRRARQNLDMLLAQAGFLFQLPSGVSSERIPPCGNCQPSRRVLRAQNTRPSGCIRMMPTFGRYPSGSIIARPPKNTSARVPQHPGGGNLRVQRVAIHRRWRNSAIQTFAQGQDHRAVQGRTADAFRFMC